MIRRSRRCRLCNRPVGWLRYLLVRICKTCDYRLFYGGQPLPWRSDDGWQKLDWAPTQEHTP